MGTNFTEMDNVLEQLVQDMSANEEMVLRAKNTLDLFKIPLLIFKIYRLDSGTAGN